MIGNIKEILLIIYKCGICEKIFSGIPEENKASCEVFHLPGSCCHFGEREISDEQSRQIKNILGGADTKPLTIDDPAFVENIYHREKSLIKIKQARARLLNELGIDSIKESQLSINKLYSWVYFAYHTFYSQPNLFLDKKKIEELPLPAFSCIDEKARVEWVLGNKHLRLMHSSKYPEKSYIYWQNRLEYGVSYFPDETKLLSYLEWLIS